MSTAEAMSDPPEYDPSLTEQLLEEGDKLLDESRRLLADIGHRLHEDADERQ